jgi:hypothetical protein
MEKQPNMFNTKLVTFGFHDKLIFQINGKEKVRYSAQSTMFYPFTFHTYWS